MQFAKHITDEEADRMVTRFLGVLLGVCPILWRNYYFRKWGWK